MYVCGGNSGILPTYLILYSPHFVVKMSNAGMTFKRVFVRNLEERVTAADIKKLFGLDLTPYLQKNSFVDIKADESRAEVIIPGENVDDI